VTVQESRALVARGKPYVASRLGKTTIHGF